MNADLVHLPDRLLAGLVNGVYQGLMLTAAVWLCLKLMGRANAATRHAIWLLTLAGVVALPVVHIAIGPGQPGQGGGDSGRAATPRSPHITAPNEAAVLRDQPLAPQVDEPTPLEGDKDSDFLLDPEEEVTVATNLQTEAPGPGWSAVWSPPDAGLRGPSVVSERAEVLGSDERNLPDSKSILWKTFPCLTPTFRLPPLLSLFVLAVLVLLAFVRLGALGGQLFLMARLKRRAKHPPADLHNRFKALVGEFRGNREAALAVSQETHPPMVVGFRHPVVLIPTRLLGQRDFARIDPILRHEIAHVRRFDDWANLAQQTAKAVFSFHPAVVWICRRLLIEREVACDDHVLHSGQEARDYALLLAEFASRSRCRDWTAAPAAWSRKSQLTERVNMILERNRNISPRLACARLGIVSTMAAVFAGLMLQLAPRLGLASQPAPKPVPDAVPGPVEPVVAPGVVALAPVASVESGVSSAGTVEAPAPRAVVAAGNGSVSFAAASGDSNLRLPASGARAKDAPAPEAIPATPADLVEPVEPVPPAIAATPGSVVLIGKSPRPSALGGEELVSDEGSSKDKSLERRLARVERMLDTLMHQRQSLYQVPPGAWSGPNPRLDGKADPFSADQWKRANEMAQRATEQALNSAKLAEDQMKRAMEQANRAQRDAHSKVMPDGAALAGGGLEDQRRALQTERQALEKQLHSIERQLERLDHQQQKLEIKKDKRPVGKGGSKSSGNENGDDSAPDAPETN